MQYKIFKLDKNFNYLTSFLKTGEGPGEVKKSPYNFLLLNYGMNDKLYIYSNMNRRLNIFSKKGKFLNDFKSDYYNMSEVKVNTKGDMLMPSVNGGLLDLYGKDLKLKKVILKSDFVRETLFFKPLYKYQKDYILPDSSNLDFDFINDNKIMIMICSVGKVIIYDLIKDKILNEYYLFIKKNLDFYKKNLKKIINLGGNSMYSNFYIDRFDRNYYYALIGGYYEVKGDNIVNYYYKFNINGKLIKKLRFVSYKTRAAMKCVLKDAFIFYFKDTIIKVKEVIIK